MVTLMTHKRIWRNLVCCGILKMHCAQWLAVVPALLSYMNGYSRIPSAELAGMIPWAVLFFLVGRSWNFRTVPAVFHLLECASLGAQRISSQSTALCTSQWQRVKPQKGQSRFYVLNHQRFFGWHQASWPITFRMLFGLQNQWESGNKVANTVLSWMGQS